MTAPENTEKISVSGVVIPNIQYNETPVSSDLHLFLEHYIRPTFSQVTCYHVKCLIEGLGCSAQLGLGNNLI